MNDNTAAVSPRRLVVCFYDTGQNLSFWMVKDDKGNRPQLVHKAPVHRAPDLSRVNRLFLRLRLKSGPSKALDSTNQRNNQTIADAYEFVSRNYQSDDQVVLLTYQYDSGDYVIKATEILARHLQGGTRPEPTNGRSNGGGDTPGKRIPIYGIVVIGREHLSGAQSICLISDELKSRFSPGIEHIFCYYRSDSDHWGCYTMFDLGGSIISRKISMYEGYSFRDRLIHITKDIVYYHSQYIPDWDEQEPVWKKVLDSSPTGIPRNFPSSMLPAGIYQQELSRYQGGPELSDRLVWKSFRH